MPRTKKPKLVIIQEPQNDSSNNTHLLPQAHELITEIESSIDADLKKIYEFNNRRLRIFDHNLFAQDKYKYLISVSQAMEQAIYPINEKIDHCSSSTGDFLIQLLKEKQKITHRYAKLCEPEYEFLKALEDEAYPNEVNQHKIDKIYYNTSSRVSLLIEKLSRLESELPPENLFQNEFSSLQNYVASINTIMAQLDQTDLSPLNETSYSQFMHAKNNVMYYEEQFYRTCDVLTTKLQVQKYNNEIAPLIYDLRQTYYTIYGLQKRYQDVKLVNELNAFLSDQNGLFKYDYKNAELSEAKTQYLSSLFLKKEEIQQIHASMKAIINKHLERFKNIEDGITFLSARTRVLGALSNHSISNFKALEQAILYPYNNPVTSPIVAEKNACYLHSLITNDFLKDDLLNQCAEAKRYIEEFYKNVPAIEHNATHFIYHDKSYLLEESPLVRQYIEERARMIIALSKGDNPSDDYNLSYSKLLEAQNRLNNYLSKKETLGRQQETLNQLSTEVKTTLSNIPLVTNCISQAKLNQNFRESIRILYLSIKQKIKACTIENISTNDEETINFRKQYELLFSSYKEKSHINEQIETLQQDLNSKTKALENLKDIYLTIINSIGDEINRILYSEGRDRRIAILTKLKLDIESKISEIEPITTQLTDINSKINDPASIERNRQKLSDFSDVIRDINTKAINDIQRILADDAIAELTYAIQNSLFAFINRYILRPLIAIISKVSQMANLTNKPIRHCHRLFNPSDSEGLLKDLRDKIEIAPPAA
ncbi:MAG TPA: hypothetical protein PK657_03765 [Legionella sp.]|nr:hypothetical protein [Legionella sp.]